MSFKIPPFFGFFSLLILLVPVSGFGSLVKPIGKQDASSFEGSSLASCYFWLRISFSFDSLRSML